MDFLYCRDVAEIYRDLAAVSCCDSCHEDHDDHGYDLCERGLPDGRVARLCCWMANAFDALSMP